MEKRSALEEDEGSDGRVPSEGKAWKVREEWATDRERCRSLQTLLLRTGRRLRKVGNVSVQHK